MSIKCSNMDFLFVSLCFENNLLVFFSCHAGFVSNSLLLLHLVFSSLVA